MSCANGCTSLKYHSVTVKKVLIQPTYVNDVSIAEVHPLEPQTSVTDIAGAVQTSHNLPAI